MVLRRMQHVRADRIPVTLSGVDQAAIAGGLVERGIRTLLIEAALMSRKDPGAGLGEIFAKSLSWPANEAIFPCCKNATRLAHCGKFHSEHLS